MRKKLLRSRSGFEKPESREEAIMQNILGASNVLEPAESNIEEILQAILYNTPYTKKAESEIEKILLAIKNNGTYDGEGESRDMKILIAILNGLDYAEEAESRIEELYVEWLQQRQQIKVIEGVPPLSFTSKGNPLTAWSITGNTVQNGTPTPENPVEVLGCGDYDSETGLYRIPVVTSADGTEPITTPIYLDKPLYKIGDYADTLCYAEQKVERRIKELVLTGKENWVKSGTYKGSFYAQIVTGILSETYTAFCSHLAFSKLSQYAKGKFCFNGGSTKNCNLWLNQFDSSTTVGDFKSYLAAQYAAGTPVKVSYVMQTPETKPVEPVEIPTLNGTTVIDVDTAVKPSSIYIEYK